MEISEILQNKLKQLKKQKVVNRTDWQLEALETIKKLVDGNKYKGSIFRCYKIDRAAAKVAFLDSMELGKPFSLYFLKVFNSVKKARK